MTKNRDKRATIRIGKRNIPIPGSRRARIALGSGLVAGGIVGFLPVVGFWMLPLGLMVLSVDSKSVRRSRRRMAVAWGRWRQRESDSMQAEGGVPDGPKRKGRD
jgi:hypothetical protein